jgi:hypothetical protein
MVPSILYQEEAILVTRNNQSWFPFRLESRPLSKNLASLGKGVIAILGIFLGNIKSAFSLFTSLS